MSKDDVVAAVVARRAYLSDLFKRYPWKGISADLQACERLISKASRKLANV